MRNGLRRSGLVPLLGCLGLLALSSGCREAPAGARASNPESAPTVTRASHPQSAEKGSTVYERYSVVSERDIFRPLVTGAQEQESGEASKKAEKEQASSASSPVGPTDKLALTGVVELGGRAIALVENTETNAGDFAGVGETLFGFQVVRLTAREVGLKGADGKEYTLTMGEKEIEESAAAATEPERQPAARPRPSTGPSARRRGRPRFDAERMKRFLDRLPPERRAIIEQRMRERQAR